MEDINSWAKYDLKAHRRKVFCLGWNCDGSRLATGSQDQTIKIWKTTDGQVSSKYDVELRGHTDAVVYMRWHPTSPDRLASTSSQEKCVRFFDPRTGKNTATLDTPGHNLYLAWTSDGNHMAVGSKEDVVCVVDVRKLKVLQKQAYKHQVNELGFVAGSKMLLQASGNNGEMEAIQFPELKRLKGIKGHTAAVLSLAVDPQEKYVATGGADAVACVWDTEEFICQQSYYHMEGPLRALAWSHDSRYLAMTGEDPCVYVEDVENETSLGVVGLNGGPEDCAWHPKQHVVAYPYSYEERNEFQSVVEFRRLKTG